MNTATSADLEQIYGIGDVIAQRILSYKNRFGAFVSMEQLLEVWGFLQKLFRVYKSISRLKRKQELKKSI